ncbi:MAG: hypothetical protein GC152_09440 [Alphaproteobacteria bacterium]|nr:hypothetical protein [Alphaproteobacteria bacterium]
MPASSSRFFQYRAIDGNGRMLRGTLTAADEREAALRLQTDGLTVVELSLQGVKSSQARGEVSDDVRVAILQQLAIMSRAGVDLLEALESMATGMSGPAAPRIMQVAVRLRRGEPLSEGFKAEFKGYPGYVHALLQVGEATGRLDRAIDDAARQLAFELRIRKELGNSLAYPAFLVIAGCLAIGFLFYDVVPKFADMIGENVSELDGLAKLVIGTGMFVRSQTLMVVSVAGSFLALVVLFLSNSAGRRSVYDAALNLPVIGGILKSRERATWARILHLALANGVSLLDAVRLASASIPAGSFQRSLSNVERLIRSGRRFDEALADHRLLTSLDRSLIGAGLRSGALPAMLAAVAERYDEELRDGLKRLTSLVEPIAIGVVSLIVGAVAIGLITAMSSVYESVV